jgi:DNA end-binding protein Ku
MLPGRMRLRSSGEAMRGKALVALGRFVLARRERVLAIEPHDKGLIATTPHYACEMRNARDCFADTPDYTGAFPVRTR